MSDSTKLQEMEKTVNEFLLQTALLKQEQIEGRKKTSSLSLYDEYPSLSDPRLFAELSEASEIQEDGSGLKNLLMVMAEHRCMRPFVEIEDDVSDICNSRILRIGEEDIPYSVSEYWTMRQKERYLREVMEKERGKVINEINSYLSQAHASAHERCMELGFTSIEQMWRFLWGTDFNKLKENCQELLSETEDIFRDHMRWLSRRMVELNPSEMKRNDVLFAFSCNEYNDRLPLQSPRNLLLDTMEDMGLPLQEPENPVLYNMESENALPVCVPIETPEKVILYYSSCAGLNGYTSVFHELGRALFFANMSAGLPARFRYAGKPAIPQTFAFLFASLLREPLWLKRHLDIENEPDLIRTAYLEKLYSVRAQAGRFMYELEMSSNAPSDDGRLFRESMHHATGVDYPPERRFIDIPPWFRNATNLIAWSLEAHLRKRMIEEYDEDWFRNPGSGDILKELWAAGFKTEPEVITRWANATLTDFNALIEDFQQHLA